MDYLKLRPILLDLITALNSSGYSYQDMTDSFNQDQSDFILFKDFFSRFRSNPTYYDGKAKHSKLLSIYTHLSQLENKNSDKSNSLDREISTIIRKGLDAEFQCFTKINREELNISKELDPYFWKDGVAFKKIQQSLLQKEMYEWVLDHDLYGSSFTLLKFKLESVFEDTAVVKTQEHWKLHWLEKSSDILQYQFDLINEQSYLVTLNDNTWKIKDNIYITNLNKKRPEFYTTDSLKQILRSSANPKSIIKSFISNNDLAKAIDSLLLFKNISKRKTSSLQVQKEDYLALLRELNIGRIDYTQFLDSIQKQKSTLVESMKRIKLSTVEL